MLKFNLIEVVNVFYRYEVFPEEDVTRREIFEFNPWTSIIKKIKRAGLIQYQLLNIVNQRVIQWIWIEQNE